MTKVWKRQFKFNKIFKKMNCIILYNNIWYNHIIKYIFYYYTVLTNNKFITSHNEHISVHKPHKLTTKQDECDKDNENQKNHRRISYSNMNYLITTHRVHHVDELLRLVTYVKIYNNDLPLANLFYNLFKYLNNDSSEL